MSDILFNRISVRKDESWRTKTKNPRNMCQYKYSTGRNCIKRAVGNLRYCTTHLAENMSEFENNIGDY